VNFSPSGMASDLAASGPPLFFPDPPTPVTFNFDQGLASEETFPLDDFRRLAVEILDRDGARALEYISFDFDVDRDQLLYLPTYIELVLGNIELRRELASWLGRKQNRPDLVADSIILTSGSVQGLALAFNALVNAGEGVIVESASFPYALRYLEMRNADIRTAGLDDDGIVVRDVERLIAEFQAEGVRPKLIYTIPTFQLPTGVCTSTERRKQLIALAEEHDLLIIEDNVYGDLRVEGTALPTMLELDTTDRVLQAHSFSKILAPGIRLGWMCAHPDLIALLASVRQDLGMSQWFSRMMTEFMREGRLDPHIDQANSVYRRKRDIAVAAMREHCGEFVDFRVPEGGFYLWLEMTSDRVDWDKAQSDAAMNGVFCRPGERFMGEEAGKRFLRLAFSHVGDEELQRGIEVLGKSIRGAVI
jgi:2-aminoadipate transaminase